MLFSFAPSGFSEIEEWLLHVIYEQPNVPHSTYTLFRQLEPLLQAEPSQRETVNRLRAAMGNPPLSEEQYVSERKLDFNHVQTAVESLIEQGFARGVRDTGADGVYFKDLKLTNKGEAAAIRGKRKREKPSAAVPNFEERLRGIRERMDADKNADAKKES